MVNIAFNRRRTAANRVNFIASAVAEWLEPRQLLTAIAVTNTNDSGTGSLRAAITAVNGGTATGITFNITGGNPRIFPGSPLPAITAANITIDGTTQSGYLTLSTGPVPVVEINGSGAGSNTATAIGLTLEATGITVKGLIIDNFAGPGIKITQAGSTAEGSDTIQSCLIGTNVAGTAASGNQYGISIAENGNIIGGTTLATRNVISGNTLGGVQIAGIAGGYTGNVVEGNYIGLNAAGNAAIPNLYGVIVSAQCSASTYNLIGGFSAAAANVISGNTNAGVWLTSASGQICSYNSIAGNLIGTDPTGSSAIPNATGILLGLGTSIINNTIGGNPNLTSVYRNVISGNTGDGIDFADASAQSNTTLANYIGTNISGTAALANAVGVELAGAPYNFVGSTVSSEVISGNTTYGIKVDGPGAQSNDIQDNLIGVSATGTALGNGSHGIYFTQNGQTAQNLVGGVAIGDGNTIANNGGAGVYVDTGVPASNASGYENIYGNSIYNNSGLGIDLAPAGVNANHNPVVTGGANNSQNYPVITSVVDTASGQSTSFSLFAAANSTFTIQLFSSPSLDPSGYGEGQTFVASGTVTTNSSGNATGALGYSGVASGSYMTATATDSHGNTSEFSLGVLDTRAPIIVTNTADSGTGSLRAAITLANNDSLPDTIIFNIPAGSLTSGLALISPASALPNITTPVSIDGSTEAAFLGQTYISPDIVLNGTSAGSLSSGLGYYAGSSGTINDLDIENFKSAGILASNPNSLTITGNYIGINAAGTTAAANDYGVFISNTVTPSPVITIGGTAAQRNVVSGNTAYGLYMIDAGYITVQGNYIGTNAAGPRRSPTAGTGSTIFHIPVTPTAT